MINLLLYFSILTWRSFYALILSYKVLGINRYPSSIYFNTALMMPMFWDYRDLVNLSIPNSNKIVVKISALMLLEDILIDDLSTDPHRMISIFEDFENFLPENDTEVMVKLLLSEISSVKDTKQLELLKSLNLAQINVEKVLSFNEMQKYCEEKGLWFPAIVYPFNPSMSVNEISALKQLGFWIKCVDDVVDFHEDSRNLKNNIFTHQDFKEQPDQYLEKLRKKVFAEISALKYEKLPIFLYRISISTYSFKLHNELLMKSPVWYSRVIKRYEPLQFINIVIACIFGVRELLKIKLIK